jgi:hypothetical protein
MTDEPATEQDLDRLAAALDARDLEDARRWIVPAGAGLTAVAVSLFVPWQLAEGPIGPIGRIGGPVVVLVGLAAGIIALAVARARPDTVVQTATACLASGIVIGLGSARALWAPDAASGPWLALLGAVITATATAARVVTGSDRARPST